MLTTKRSADLAVLEEREDCAAICDDIAKRLRDLGQISPSLAPQALIDARLVDDIAVLIRQRALRRKGD
jgi:hypothetical protein